MSEETKKCPFCAEEIRAEAIKCKHCGERLDVAPAEQRSHPPPPEVVPLVPAPPPPVAVTAAAAPASPAPDSTPGGEKAAPAPATPAAKPKKWVSGSEWWYFAPVPMFVIGGCPGLAAALAAGAIALKTTRNATTKQQKVVVAVALYCVAAILPVAVVAKTMSGDLFRQSVEVVEAKQPAKEQEKAPEQTYITYPANYMKDTPTKNQREEREKSPVAADSELTAEGLCMAIRDTATPACVRCVQKFIHITNRAIKKCISKCAARNYEDNWDYQVCESECLEIATTHFTNNGC